MNSNPSPADPTEQLQLTVHSVSAAQPVAPRGRLKLLALLLLTSLPLIVAYVAFIWVRPQGQASLGELIHPARPMPEALLVQPLAGAAQAPDGSVPLAQEAPLQPLARYKGQWLLLKVDGGACAQRCEQSLGMLRQLRLTLGKDQTRVDWLWLIDDAAAVAVPQFAALIQGQALVARADAQALRAWLPKGGADLHDWIFVVDPLGNAMWRVPAQLDARAASAFKRDLERLLRASASWDMPGR